MKRIGLLSPESERKRHHARKPLEVVSDDQLNRAITGLASPPVTPEKGNGVHVSQSELGKAKRRLDFTIAEGTVERNTTGSVYSLGKSLFLRGSECDKMDDQKTLVSRQQECDHLQSFIETNLAKNNSASIYISGPPGTGKTAQTMSLLDWYTDNAKSQRGSIYDVQIAGRISRVSVVKVNCMAVARPEDVYRIIHREISQSSKRQKLDSETLSKVLADKSICDMNIVVLDELDNLVNKNQQVLFELFTWASNHQQGGPNLLLIGIANALDLTDRFLPRLKNNQINPEVLAFMPYTAEQTKEVIMNKLRILQKMTGGDLDAIPLIQPVAITLCSKKVASNTGDIRKALDIIHRSLDVIEETTRSKVTQSEFDSLTLESAPKVNIGLVAKVCNSIFGVNVGSTKLSGYNLQHKLVLCALANYESHLLESKGKITTVTGSGGSPRRKRLSSTVNGLYEFYTKHVNTDKLMGTLKRGEFIEILNSLESSGSVTIGSGTQTLDYGQSPVSCSISRKELLEAVSDNALLQKVITKD
ncbi:unnamed protein product [Kuraishia capsulata CBS 1993]|uniref:Cell division control protein n=1 Tax=Kuraishia capsulata CBS 1993 TaxID=1382522 RepID=W6MRZ8_9ASCO|nr:uncharacterized protein KUCA_T00005155001 [Kuraishia capsulata CBS 1993]CDK29168.1 unnamed protein product [Kuraishia capsulata CBS 1993]